jgi:hypothetical protein
VFPGDPAVTSVGVITAIPSPIGVFVFVTVAVNVYVCVAVTVADVVNRPIFVVAVAVYEKVAAYVGVHVGVATYIVV